MRKVIFGGACSLDNYIARQDGAIDWLMWSDEVAEISAASWQRFDTVLMGRKTFEAALRLGQSPAMPSVATFVVSHTLNPPEDRSYSVISDNVGDAVRAMKNVDGKDICLMGGGVLANSLFEEGLIDVLEMNVHPLLLGTGLPLFNPMSRQLNLELREARTLGNGCMILAYDVAYPG